MRGVRIELTGIGPDEAANIARKLNHGHLHSQTYAEKRDVILSCVANGLYLAFATAIAKSARYQNSVDLISKCCSSHFFNFLSLNTVDLDFRLVGDAAVNQSLEKALVRLLEAHVFPNNRDFDGGFRCGQDLNGLLPLLKIR